MERADLFIQDALLNEGRWADRINRVADKVASAENFAGSIKKNWRDFRMTYGFPHVDDAWTAAHAENARRNLSRAVAGYATGRESEHTDADPTVPPHVRAAREMIAARMVNFRPKFMPQDMPWAVQGGPEAALRNFMSPGATAANPLDHLYGTTPAPAPASTSIAAGNPPALRTMFGPVHPSAAASVIVTNLARTRPRPQAQAQVQPQSTVPSDDEVQAALFGNNPQAVIAALMRRTATHTASPRRPTRRQRQMQQARDANRELLQRAANTRVMGGGSAMRWTDAEDWR